MSRFNDQSSGLKPEGLFGVNARIRGHQGVPGAFPLPVEELWLDKVTKKLFN
ncbi:MAG: hypothetical protein LKK16_09045 [Bacteroidales bacterium]|jgi:hypothetical protein|nr:hypothetical protein [Bacteroidales bacterium]